MADQINGMSFPRAMAEIMDGRKVTRMAWADKEVYLVLRNEQLQIKNAIGYHPLIVSEGDMLAYDWITVEKEEKESETVVINQS